MLHLRRPSTLKEAGTTVFSIGLVFAALVFIYLVYLNSQLPSVSELVDPDYSLPTIIYDRNGQRVNEIFIKRRKLVSYDQLPPHLINGLIAKEDSRFFDHFGIDPLRMLKAAWVNALAWDTVQGASTLTQQTARQFFLTLEKTWVRKIKEILLAMKIERDFTKEEILTLYLNKVNFGDAWGVSAAAEYYYNKRVEDLTLSESGVLVGLLPAPNKYKPNRNPNLARQQRNIVLQRMYEEGFISRGQMMAAASEPIVLAETTDTTMEATADYVEYVRRVLLENYGSKSLYEGGLHVYTAMDLSYQVAAHEALVKGVRDLDRRRGFRPPEDTVVPDNGKIPDEILESLNAGVKAAVGKVLRAIVLTVNDEELPAPRGVKGAAAVPPHLTMTLGTENNAVLTWNAIKEDWNGKLVVSEEKHEDPRTEAISKISDILHPFDMIQVEIKAVDQTSGEFIYGLYQEPLANGSLFALVPQTGDVVAMSGGIRFGRGDGASEFIRAIQAERQPGSSFKPLIYAAAIEEGYTPATMLDDSPRVFTLQSGKKHIPQNYDNTYMGPLSLRNSLSRSRNVPTVQLVDEMGARKVIEYARRFGIQTPIPEESIIALGTHSIRLSDLTRAYGVFPAGGKLVKSRFILRIVDAKGNEVMKSEPESTQAISEASAYLLSDMLRDVVRMPWGTANRAMEGYKRPSGGKTGTTQNYTDAWYIGFIPQMVTGVYVGFDDPTISLGPSETGSRTAAPIWRQFMEHIEGSLPVETFIQPESVLAMRVSPTGTLLGPCDQTSGSHFELFKQETVPERLRQGKDSCFGVFNSEQPPAGGTPGGGDTPKGSGTPENVEL
ncbi:MAG: PBP1A family penicillin-binding protein [Deltaproteobacteria bacterium]|nr:PBP1A family penicillin-binding protein [Deltaproteobacteria bacterium]